MFCDKFAALCIVALCLLHLVRGECRKMRVRKEIHDLSPRELYRLTNAINLLHESVSKVSASNSSVSLEVETALKFLADHEATSNMVELSNAELYQKGLRIHKAQSTIMQNFEAVKKDSQSVWEEFVVKHGQNVMAVHQTPAFLPWHRWLIYELETKLQEVAKDPDLTLPYWAWSYASDARDAMVIRHFGNSAGKGFGKPLPIPDGPFKNWRASYVVPHRVARGYNPDAPLNQYRHKCFENVFREYPHDYEHIRPLLEIMHNAFHDSIGGDMSNVHIAANDPLFYLHHAYVDYEWWKWQHLHQGNVHRYEGFDVERGAFVSTFDMLPGFGVTVEDALYSEGFCVTYEAPRRAFLSTAGSNSSTIPEISSFSLGLMGLTQAQVDLVKQLEGTLKALCQ